VLDLESKLRCRECDAKGKGGGVGQVGGGLGRAIRRQQLKAHRQDLVIPGHLKKLAARLRVKGSVRDCAHESSFPAISLGTFVPRVRIL
jgi:hypothetical protein